MWFQKSSINRAKEEAYMLKGLKDCYFVSKNMKLGYTNLSFINLIIKGTLAVKVLLLHDNSDF